MVRFVHLSPDAPALDLTFIASADTLFTAQPFRQASDFKEIAADTYTVSLSDATGGDLELSSSNVEILPGKFYTIIVRGFATPPQGNTNILSMEVLD